MFRLSIAIFISVHLSVATLSAKGQELSPCDHCGCHAACQRVCRLVREDKKVDVVCWGCQCEDFCVPGPSRPGCRHCETACVDCNDFAASDAPSTSAKPFVWTDWIPGQATILSRKKLMKRTVTRTVPSYHWVVEQLCPHCCAALDAPAGEQMADLPLPTNVVTTASEATVAAGGY